MASSILHIDNAEYIEALYQAWLEDHGAVPPEWARFFEGESNGIAAPSHLPSAPSPAPATAQGSAAADMVYKQSRVDSLLWAYRDVGYLYAHLNPLVGRFAHNHNYLQPLSTQEYEELSLEEFGLSSDDLDTEFSAGRYMRPSRAPLREILDAFRETYCRTIGVEFLHIQNKAERRWLIERMESTRNQPTLTNERKRIILEDLIEAEEFEHFLHTTFIGQKRFSLEGAEALIPGLHFLVDSAHSAKIEEMVIGMSHRGRLTVLNRIMNKPAEEIFSEFEGDFSPGQYGGSGDVKYHLGYSTDHINEDGSTVHISIVSNPSHLESVDPVVQGKARGEQRRHGDIEERKRVVPVLLHGDAAFSGQGVVAETLNLSGLRGYKTGGTIHFIVNNQIGFTTSTRDLRSTFFPTDIAKMIQVPVFHVNGDDPEAVVHVVRLAMDYRQTFGKDAVVDIFCYRRYGHNEGDEPSFTHPRMYDIIQNRPSVAEKYAGQCVADGSAEQEWVDARREEFRAYLKESLEKEREEKRRPTVGAFQGPAWSGLQKEYSHEPVETAIDEQTAREIAGVLTAEPPDFSMHPKLKRIVEQKRKAFFEKGTMDWAFAEAIAFGSLLLEGYPIRLSGEDSARGTFSQRHATWWDVETDMPSYYVPLNHLSEEQAPFSVYDSPLSEFSVLGFEYGYSLAQPNMLVMWEAQFGDFCNGGQVIIDNFIVAGETKWNRASGLVMLLPHGYEGQGPEHSSGHMARFLQLCAEENIQVCNATLPGQYFHLLRRQLLRNFRKPLVIMTPKSLLRHPAAVSKLSDLTSGTFQEVLPDPHASERPKRVLLCSGKVYYDLRAAQEKNERGDVAVIRMEQLYPFPEAQLQAVLSTYGAPNELVWVQEEPRNRGGWTFMREQLARCLPDVRLRYVGRPAAASPATGSHKRHQHEQQAIVENAFSSELVDGYRLEQEHVTSVAT